MKKYLLFLGVILLWGCIEDKGNYEYIPCRDLTVKNMESGYILTVGESVELTPKVIVEYDKTETEIKGAKLEWKLNQKVVCNEPVFVFEAETNGLFAGLLRIIDPVSGSSSFQEFTITVQSKYENGFVILAEEGGKSRLSFIRSKWTSKPDTVVYAGEYKHIYIQENGEDLKGLPYSVTEHWKNDNGEQNGELTLITADGQGVYAQELNGESMKRETWIRQEFENGVLPAGCRPKQILHTCWDSFILDESGKVYTRRSGTKEGFHTGYFSDKIALWNSQKFDRLFFNNYNQSGVILALEIDEENGEKNYVGIYSDNWRPTNNLKRLKITGESDDFYDVKDEILFSDWRCDDNYYGTMSVVQKTPQNDYVLHCFGIGYSSQTTTTMDWSVKINLTEELGVTRVNGMCTNKQSNYTYFCDDHTIYWVDNEYDEDWGEMKTFGKKIVTITDQSVFIPHADYPVSLAIGFEDGTVEVWEIGRKDAASFTKRVFISEHSFGKIKQILGKAGNSSSFFLM